MSPAELLELAAVEPALPLLLWRLDEPVTVASTAPAGGGIGPRRWIINAQVPSSYSRRDPERHIGELASALGLSGPGVGMLTAAPVVSVVGTEEAGVTVEATVGVTHPVWAAADPVDAPAESAGTINVVAVVPAALSEAALLNLLCTATEAKAQGLALAGIPGTGTASDAITVVCPAQGPTDRFGGPRSRWGARVARAVCAAVRTGCEAPGAGGGRP